MGEGDVPQDDEGSESTAEVVDEGSESTAEVVDEGSESAVDGVDESAADESGAPPAPNDGSVFDRLPATAADRRVDGRPTREGVIAFWADRYGIDPAVFAEFTFWERGAGKIWVCAANPPTPVAVEGLGMTFLRARQDHWKPTTDAAQRFGDNATRNVLTLDAGAAATYARGEDQDRPGWDGDWGYVLVARRLAGERVVLGVGLYLHGELRSVVPKGRRRDLPVAGE